MSGPSGSRQGVADALKHPLLLVLIATLLGSVLVPHVNRRIDAEKRIRDLKSERATSVLRSARDVDQKLHLVSSSFGN